MRQLIAAVAWMFRTLPRPVSVIVVLGLVVGLLIPIALVNSEIQTARILKMSGITRAEYDRIEDDLDLAWPSMKAIVVAAQAGGATVQQVADEWARLGLDREDLAELSAAAAKEKVDLIELTSAFDSLIDFPRYSFASAKGVSFKEFKSCRSDWRACGSDYAIVNIYLGAANVTVADTCKQAASEAASYADPRIPFTAFFFPTPTATSKSLIDEGIIRLSDTVSYQNGFGAYEDVRVTCVFDIATRSAFVEAM